MPINIVQLLLIVFLGFALSRVVLQFKSHRMKNTEFGFWAVLFTTSIFVVAFPNETTKLAKLLGIGRGVDLAVYASIVTLFYLVFRIYIYIEDLRHDMTELVRKIALEKKTK